MPIEGAGNPLTLTFVGCELRRAWGNSISIRSGLRGWQLAAGSWQENVALSCLLSLALAFSMPIAAEIVYPLKVPGSFSSPQGRELR